MNSIDYWTIPDPYALSQNRELVKVWFQPDCNPLMYPFDYVSVDSLVDSTDFFSDFKVLLMRMH